jgi:hypothetical protein
MDDFDGSAMNSKACWFCRRTSPAPDRLGWRSESKQGKDDDSS